MINSLDIAPPIKHLLSYILFTIIVFTITRVAARTLAGMASIKIAGTVNDSIVDGEGYRFTIFTQGCPHHCEGCHNPQTHDFTSGKPADTEELLTRILDNPLLSGVTFSGGEPFCQPEPLVELAEKLHGNKSAAFRTIFFHKAA